jgi:hypothetical protein
MKILGLMIAGAIAVLSASTAFLSLYATVVCAFNQEWKMVGEGMVFTLVACLFCSLFARITYKIEDSL